MLILGNLLKSGQPLWLQIRQLLDLPNTDEFLNYMNTKGRETGQRSILFFDALNEADKRWEEEINGFVKKLSNYPYTGVMISLRSGVAVDKEDELRHD